MLYLDNAATSHPKPPAVYRAVLKALEEVGASPGRGAYRLAREAMEIVNRARRLAATLFDVADPGRVIFTKNATEGLNAVLKGWVRPGDRVVTSALDHNAVARPLRRLAAAGAEVVEVPCGSDGLLDLDAFERALSATPRLAVLCHASNVNGALLPLAEVAALCHARGVPLLLDAAQTAGLQPISFRNPGLGMLACSGHKALLGPPGTGLLILREDLDMPPLLEGGTGSRSEELEQPCFCPDRHESGSPNLPGIAGLAAGIEHVLEAGPAALLGHELALAERLEAGLEALPGVRVSRPARRGTGVVSFVVSGMNPGDVGRLLDEGFDIAVRTGLHCAPLAHRTFGTFPEGTVRVSPGFATTGDEIDFFLESLGALLALRR